MYSVSHVHAGNSKIVVEISDMIRHCSYMPVMFF